MAPKRIGIVQLLDIYFVKICQKHPKHIYILQLGTKEYLLYLLSTYIYYSIGRYIDIPTFIFFIIQYTASPCLHNPLWPTSSQTLTFKSYDIIYEFSNILKGNVTNEIC